MASCSGLLVLSVLSGLALAGCEEAPVGPASLAPTTSPAASAPGKQDLVAQSSAASAAAGRRKIEALSPSRADCETAQVFEAGASIGAICIDDAERNGLTVLDLSDTWTPRVFAADAKTGSAPDYRAKYLELASLPTSDLALNGITSSLTVLSGRVNDEHRRTCDAAVDLRPLTKILATWSTAPDDRSRAAVLKSAEAKPAVRALQSQLACSGLLKESAVTGVMGTSTQIALDAFRRRHLIVGTGVDAETLLALTLGGEELAFRGVLRGLRERVAEGAGLIEDGSASGHRALVIDRELDLSVFAPPVEGALEEGSPDLVDAATDSAARELGWTRPDAVRGFLAARGKNGVRSLHVAVALPPAPAYHTATMDLRVEIDRGDIVYEAGHRGTAARKKIGAVRGPSFVVYAKDGDRDRPLIRWSTTIGGWKKERTLEGEIALKYKESDVGDRMWRQVIAAPAWMPPDSTPETDLLREGQDGTFALKRDLIQPGYRNAYGLVMLIHDEKIEGGDKTRWADHGIRTHGSVDYKSIARGESHGCHRLYNQLALRLSGYLLQHRNHVRKGKMHAGYHRTLAWADQTVEVDVETRGYLYEMDPPVPVRVLPGRVVGKAQKPVSSLIRIEPATPKQG